jgi:hypothetical protein
MTIVTQMKEWFLSRLVPNVFPCSCKGFQMFTPTSERVSSWMCQHGMVNERHWRPSSFIFAHIL